MLLSILITIPLTITLIRFMIASKNGEMSNALFYFIMLNSLILFFFISIQGETEYKTLTLAETNKQQVYAYENKNIKLYIKNNENIEEKIIDNNYQEYEIIIDNNIKNGEARLEEECKPTDNFIKKTIDKIPGVDTLKVSCAKQPKYNIVMNKEQYNNGKKGFDSFHIEQIDDKPEPSQYRGSNN